MSESRWKDIGHGIILDTKTDLEWSQNGINSPYKGLVELKESSKIISQSPKSIADFGHCPWRLPTNKEIDDIFDAIKANGGKSPFQPPPSEWIATFERPPISTPTEKVNYAIWPVRDSHNLWAKSLTESQKIDQLQLFWEVKPDGTTRCWPNGRHQPYKIDNPHNLTWLHSSTAIPAMTWENSKAYIAKFKDSTTKSVYTKDLVPKDGSIEGDWRLPKESELRFLANIFSFVNWQANFLYLHPTNENVGFWCVADDPDADDKQRLINLHDGTLMDIADAQQTGYILPVRSSFNRWAQKDGVVTDHSNNLVWYQLSSGGVTLNWENANKAIAQLPKDHQEITDGSEPGDWRLPTREELLWLMQGRDYVSNAQNRLFKRDSITQNLWTSTPAGNGRYAVVQPNASGDSGGNPTFMLPDVKNGFWAVRGDKTWRDNGDGTVTDHTNNLVWLKAVSSMDAPHQWPKMTWQEAQDHVSKLEQGLLGSPHWEAMPQDGSSAGTWRLPTAAELQAILEPSPYTNWLWSSLGLNDGNYWAETTKAGQVTVSVINSVSGSMKTVNSDKNGAATCFVLPVREVVDRWRDNENGTITDKFNKLVWVKKTKGLDLDITWDQAKAYVAKLASGIHGIVDASSPGDWRLPTTQEFKTLTQKQEYISQQHPRKFELPLQVQSTFWTSEETDSTTAKVITFPILLPEHKVIDDKKSAYHVVWAVRDQLSLKQRRWQDNLNGTVTDLKSGLIWLKNANAFSAMEWKKATQTAAQLQDGTAGLKDGSIAGDWRLPTAMEMSELKSEPQAISKPNMHVFTNVHWTDIGEEDSPIYWTSTQSKTGYGDHCMIFMNGRYIPYKGDTDIYVAGDTYATGFIWPVRTPRKKSS